MIEIKISVSDDEQTLHQKFLVHTEGMRLSHDDPELSAMVKIVKDRFKGTPTDILIRFKYTW